MTSSAIDSFENMKDSRLQFFGGPLAALNKFTETSEVAAGALRLRQLDPVEEASVNIVLSGPALKLASSG